MSKNYRIDEEPSSKGCDDFCTSTACRIIALCVLLAIIIGFTVGMVCLSGACDNNACSLDCSEENPHWGYDTAFGPTCWGTCYDTCRNGQKQSPIDLDDKVALGQTFNSSLQLLNYDQPLPGKLYSNGHSVEVALMGNTYEISELGLDGTYIGASFHFHWGSDNGIGSEHLFNNEAYPMEMHLVHYSSNYTGIAEARRHSNGVAVLGFLFQVSEEDNPAYAAIVNHLPQIKYPGNEVFIDNVTLLELFPNNMSNFYRYEGSLTTPGCEEAVIWTVFKHLVPLSKTQIQAFQNTIFVDEHETELLQNNYRPVQPLNGRKLIMGYQK